MIHLNFIWGKLLPLYSNTATSGCLLSCASNHFPSTVFNHFYYIAFLFDNEYYFFISIDSTSRLQYYIFIVFDAFTGIWFLQSACRVCRLPNAINVSFYRSFFTVLFDVNNLIWLPYNRRALFTYRFVHLWRIPYCCNTMSSAMRAYCNTGRSSETGIAATRVIM